MFKKRERYKIFLDSKSNFQILPITNIIDENKYYAFLQEEKTKYNLTQFLFTSKLTINLLLEILKYPNVFISKIKLFDDDLETTQEVLEIFTKYKNKEIDERAVHSRLDYFEDDYSIDIQSFVLFSNNNGMLQVYVNGIFENMDGDYWNSILLNALETVWNEESI